MFNYVIVAETAILIIIILSVAGTIIKERLEHKGAMDRIDILFDLFDREIITKEEMRMKFEFPSFQVGGVVEYGETTTRPNAFRTTQDKLGNPYE